ncbi:MAG: tetratricopeptide repeat protein [Gemmatimonadaceae bacterium]
MNYILAVHITAGALALVGGYAALFARKGGRLHRKAGILFVCAMVVMGMAATIVAVAHGKSTALGGPLVAYLVITSLITVRPPSQSSPRLNTALMVLALGIGAAYVVWGVKTLTSGNAVTDGVPTPQIGGAMVLNGVVGLLAFVGDLKVLRSGPLRGTQRLTRHLWRMCYAFFTASGSFFLGQAKVIPKPLRIGPVLAFLAVLPLLAMLYWLVRARVRRTKPFVSLPVAAPLPSVSLPLVLVALAFASSASAQSIDHARQLFDSAKYSEAKAELLALQKMSDRNPQPPYYLGRIAVITNEDDGDEAVRQFERAVALEEGNATYHTWLGNAIRDVTPRASKLRMPFNARRMKKEWERAVALDPNQIDARYGLVQFYAYAPGVMGGSKDKAREQAAEIEKNPAAEEAAYKEAIAAAPDSLPGYFGLGAVYARDGKATEAFATLDTYVRRRPDDRRAFYEAGRIAAITGRELDRGEAALKQFLATPPADARVTTIAGAHYWLGQIAEKRGLRDAAREHYLTALRINRHAQLARHALDALK